jgi:hypothetical protein
MGRGVKSGINPTLHQISSTKWRLCQPLDRQNFAARGLDARDGVACVFDRRRHVMRIGVHDGVAVAHDRDMAVPEDQVAALQVPISVTVHSIDPSRDLRGWTEVTIELSALSRNYAADGERAARAFE